MQMKITALEDLLTCAATGVVPEEQARYFAKLTLETHIKKSPRMNPLKEAVSDIKVWKDQKDHRMYTIAEKPGTCVIDFNRLAPSLKIKEIHDGLIRRAGQNGIAAAGFKNSAGVITLNMWADGLAKQDVIGIAMFNGGTQCCVPHGGTKGVLGTNPLAFAIPTQDQPITLDMATTQIPFFDIKRAKEKHTPLPENSAVDKEGVVTTDAAKALDDEGIANILPMGGGFKGYGLMMLIEILTGSLIQSMLSTEQTSGWHPPEYGCLILAIDIKGFTDINSFKTRVSMMCKDLRNHPPGKNFDAVAIPGDRGQEKLRQALSTGEINIEKDDYQTLMGLKED